MFDGGGVRSYSGGVTRKINEVGGLSSTPPIKIVRSDVGGLTIVVGGFNPPDNSHPAAARYGPKNVENQLFSLGQVAMK